MTSVGAVGDARLKNYVLARADESVFTSALSDRRNIGAAQHFLYLNPEPHQHGWLRRGGQAITSESPAVPRYMTYSLRVSADSGGRPCSAHQAVNCANRIGTMVIAGAPCSEYAISRCCNPDPADPDVTKRARLPKVTVRRLGGQRP